MTRSRTAVVTGWMLAAGVAAAARAADGPVSTPAVPAGPAENDLDRAKRDAGKSVNDAGRAAGNGGPVDRQVDAAKRDAADATAAKSVASTRPTVAPDAEAVRKLLADVAAIAVAPDHMDRLTQRLAQPDRDRLRAQPGYAKGFGPDLDTAAVRFAAAWKAKYGHGFTAAGAEAAVNDAFADVQAAASLGPTTDAEAMVHVVVSASRGLPAVTVNLAREMPDGWKVDVPGTADVDALRRNLADEIGAAVATGDQWPADEADAYRAVTHRVLLAVTGRPLPPR